MTSIEVQGYKKQSPYFAVHLLDDGQQVHTANCKANYPQRKISVKDNHGNEGSVYITFNLNRDLHNMLKEWYDKQPN